MSSHIEDMNDALIAVGLCWSKDAPVICSDMSPEASPDARNKETLTAYVGAARCKGVTFQVFADAVLSKYEGDEGPLLAILTGPNV